MTLQQPIQSSAKDSCAVFPPKQVSAGEVKKELLEWAQRATEGYDDVSVKDFTHSWKNGMAFCAIIDRHRWVVVIIHGVQVLKGGPIFYMKLKIFVIVQRALWVSTPTVVKRTM